jgi:hypothetical protein
MESSSGVRVGIIKGVTVGTIVDVIVGVVDGSIVGVIVGAVVKSLGFFSLSDFLHPLNINNNAIIKILIINLFFFTLLFSPGYTF